jgi:hypothetical protein
MRRPILVVVGVALLAALAPTTSASAHFDRAGQYTHNGCPGNSSNRVDPINIVFYNWGTWDRGRSNLEYHARWFDSGGSTQYFVDHSSCHPMHVQRASGCTACSRFHIRLRGQHSDVSLGWTSTGDAHHEDLVWYCGHAVDSNGPSGSGFDQGRREVRIRVGDASGHSWHTENWGNTQNFQQCDGDWARSDGIVTFINLHQGFH